MPIQRSLALTAAVLVTAWFASGASAEIISYAGSVSAQMKELNGASVTNTALQEKRYPDPNETLPLQVIARLFSDAERSGGSAAAQFADPQTVSGDNPEEFAINLALDSIGPTLLYQASASAQELRTIRFSPAEVGGAADGQVVSLRGRLFLDGALSMFSSKGGITDLSGASVTLKVTVVKEVTGQAAQTVFFGALNVTGGADNEVSVTAEGDLPLKHIFDANLAALDPQLEVFRVFVLPAVTLDYTYEATVGQQFALRVTVAVGAANIPGGMGVAAILGTPVQTLQDIIARTQSAATAKNIVDGMLKERSEPSGRSLYEQQNTPPSLFNLCGLLGFESLLMIVGLVGLRRRYVRRVASSE
jgi:hypothetical protein